MRLRWTLPLLAAAAVAVAARRPSPSADMDFEFDDTAEPPAAADDGAGESARRPRRYVYDPHNPLCLALVCKKRAVCVLRDAYTPLCATKKDILRRGDVLVTAGTRAGAGQVSAEDDHDHDDDVFYEGGAAAGGEPHEALTPDRCVGCGGGGGGGGGFLCGSDNRTYSSLCRLDLHNCVRRPAPPVALSCRGFCPCIGSSAGGSHRARRPRRPARRPSRPNPAHNEVTPRRRAPVRGCALDKMADRLLDWFSVLMEEASATPPPRRGFPADCKPEVRWMFLHLDSDGDGRLSAGDLYALRHDERERCLRPFLASCGGGRGEGAGGGVSRGAWCGCLRRAVRPCTALARAHSGAGGAGGYVPACDARGYYRPRQCHAALGVCWCVDAHGTEMVGSRGKGARACPGDAHAPPDDEDASPAAGSGDGDGEEELRY